MILKNFGAKAKKIIAAHQTSPKLTFRVNRRSTDSSCLRLIAKRAKTDLLPSRLMDQVPDHLQDYPWPILT